MAEGFIREKVTTVFKGPYLMYWKEVREGKRSVRHIILLRSLLFEDIPQKVLKKHNIEKAIKLQVKADKVAEEISEDLYKMAFNVELEEEAFDKMVMKIENAWAKAREKIESGEISEEKLILEIDEHFQAEVIKLVIEEDKEERDIYWHYLEPVIKETEKGGREAAMARVAQMFKTKEDVSRLAGIAIKWEARALRRGFIGLKRDKKRLIGAFSKLWAKKANVTELTKELDQIDKSIIRDMKKEFRSTYLLLKRDLLLDLVLLGLLREDNKELREYVIKRFMPRAPELGEAEKLEKIRGEIKEHCHVIAQGMRRLIGDQAKIRRMAETEEKLAKRAEARQRYILQKKMRKR